MDLNLKNLKFGKKHDQPIEYTLLHWINNGKPYTIWQKHYFGYLTEIINVFTFMSGCYCRNSWIKSLTHDYHYSW